MLLAWSRFVIEENSIPQHLAYKLLIFIRLMRNADFDISYQELDAYMRELLDEPQLALPEHMTAKLNGANPYIQRLNQLNQRTKELHDTIQSQAAERQSKGLISAALTAAGNARGASASKAHGGIAGAFVPSKGAGARAEGEGTAAGSERPE